METVALLKSVTGEVIAIYASAVEAQALVDRYNSDPFVDGEPDVDAPYSVETWSVQQ